MSYRFRLEGELLVLQVGTYTKSRYDYEGQTTWRDATVGDIPVRDPFARDTQETSQPVISIEGYGFEGIR
jgi:hypothetical protein